MTDIKFEFSHDEIVEALIANGWNEISYGYDINGVPFSYWKHDSHESYYQTVDMLSAFKIMLYDKNLISRKRAYD